MLDKFEMFDNDFIKLLIEK